MWHITKTSTRRQPSRVGHVAVADATAFKKNPLVADPLGLDTLRLRMQPHSKKSSRRRPFRVGHYAHLFLALILNGSLIVKGCVYENYHDKLMSSPIAIS